MMKKRLWIATAIVLGAAPAWAQPDNKGAMAPSDEIAVAELEKAIGGRTMLELKFKDLNAAEATDVVAQSSELPFVAPAERLMDPMAMMNPMAMTDPRQPPVEMKWDGDVDRMDFWLALRTWGQAEMARRQRAVAQQIEQAEAAPPSPVAAVGQTVTPQAMAEWKKKRDEWAQRRFFRLMRLDNSRTLSANFDTKMGDWSLIPSSRLIEGQAVNSWPCLVLASQFQRNQNFSIRAAEAQQAEAQQTQAQQNATEKSEKTSDEAAPVEEVMVNGQRREVVTGGVMTDSLWLNMMVYLDPKLQQRATAQLWVNEARDETGEDLTPNFEELSGAAPSYSVSGGMDGGILKRIQLRPRQAKGRQLAILRGVIEVRYPMKLQKHEISSFNGPQTFSINTDDLPVEAQFAPPRLKNGRLSFATSLALEADRGGRRLMEIATRIRRNEGVPIGRNVTLSLTSYGMSPGSDFNTGRTGPLGKYLLPNYYTLVDTEGRTWLGHSESGGVSLKGPDGRSIPTTSPPTPPPDNFTYSEERTIFLQLMPQNSNAPNAQSALSPDELAKVRFVKASFTTESDWRTLEVPFEFHDLPLPPR